MLNPYIIGWIASDGHNLKDGCGWSISQNIDDSDVLYKIVDIFNIGKISVRKRNGNSSYGNKDQVCLTRRSVEESNFLVDWGVFKGKKSYSLKFPVDKMDKDIWLYLRGYFEGDGSITCEDGMKNPRIQIIANKIWCDECRKFLNKFNISSFITDDKRHVGLSEIHIRRINHLHRFVGFLYDGNLNLYMERKYNKILEVLKNNPIIQERKYLNGDEIDQIKKMLLDGIMVDKISDVFNYNKNSIWAIARKMGLGRKDIVKKREQQVELWLKQGKLIEEICHNVGYGYKLVRRVKDRVIGTEEDILKIKYQKVKNMIKDGFFVKDIAKATNCSFCKIAELRKEVIAENQGNGCVCV